MKNIELSSENIIIAGRNFLAKLKRFAPLITIVGLVAIYVFLILQISQASQQSASTDGPPQADTTIKRLKIDQDAVTKIQQLEDQNVGVKTLFQEARQNPFQGQ